MSEVIWKELHRPSLEERAGACERELTFSATVAYAGAPFAGFAKQPGQLTVQGELEQALSLLFRRSVDVVCAGRTDAGVHARGQVVSAVRDVAHKLLDALRTVAEMLADQLANRSGGQYLLLFLLLGVTLVCLIVDARAGRPVFWKGCAAVAAVIVFLALLLMYRLSLIHI